MRTVHKFPVPFSSEHPEGQSGPTMLPVGARVVHVGMNPDNQVGGVAVWIELDEHLPYDQRHNFRVFGTGRTIPDGWHYKGSTIHDRQLVWHVYGDRA